jgi:hypothetical protein
MLAAAWGMTPETVKGLHVFWQALQLYPGIVILAMVQVCTLRALTDALNPCFQLMIYGRTVCMM